MVESEWQGLEPLLLTTTAYVCSLHGYVITGNFCHSFKIILLWVHSLEATHWDLSSGEVGSKSRALPHLV